MRRVTSILQSTYGSPRLGNPRDSLDDLIFIILSARTSESSYVNTFAALRRRYPDWFDLLGAKRSEVSDIVARGGLGKKKAAQLRGLLFELNRLGIRDLGKHLERLSIRQSEEFLTTLPGVGKKTARCVLMYTANRQVFPVDTHVRRVLARLGFINPLRLTDHVQDEIQSIIPKRSRHSLHVALIAHGRAICRAGAPACSICPIIVLCPTGSPQNCRVQTTDKTRLRPQLLRKLGSSDRNPGTWSRARQVQVPN
jgi:endonuclease III